MTFKVSAFIASLTTALALSTALPAMNAFADSVSPSAALTKPSKLQQTIQRYNKTIDENEKEIIRGQIKAMYYTTDSAEEKDMISEFFRANQARREVTDDSTARRPASLN